MTDLPPPADPAAIRDLNHPRSLLILWRDEADYQDRLLNENLPVLPEVEAGFRGRISTLRHCAGQLENRLLWSGILDP